MVNQIGSFPCDWKKARETGDFIKVTDETALHMVSGKESPALLTFFASSDVTHMGEVLIPAGGLDVRQTEYDSHDGDAVFYVKQGPITFLIKDTEETFEVPEGDSMFIPKGTVYKLINYTSDIAKAIFVISPKL